MDYFDVIKKRYSVRAYKPDAVEDEKLEKILEAARLAPTACNIQPFRLAVIPTAKHMDALKKLYRGAFLTQAPVVIGIYADTQAAWSRRDRKNYADVDAAIVMDHIVLAATALGLGTCWIGAFDPQAARTLTGWDSFEPVAFTPLGYAASSAPGKARKDLGDIVTYL